jgi:hypothetical protein
MTVSIRKLCESLAQAEFENDVISILQDAGYWDDSNQWIDYGGVENNYSSIGNQQESADAALVEKIVNSIDALLINKCLEDGISPESPKSPQSIPDALKIFYGFPDGQLTSVASSQRTKLASESCGLVATGYGGKKGNPSLTIFDKGCGQEPDEFANTFLSLNASNKIKINFVQGKFNMGSTGALPFCGEHNLQLIISRRNPKLVSKGVRCEEWGFTVVRRESPTGQMKNSKYTYLAPGKKILSFKAKALQIIPRSGDSKKAYSTDLEYGSFVKLYEYNIGAGLRTNILFDLYNRLNLLMPSMPLPVRLYERREYKGKSFESTLSGLMSRVEDDKRDNLEAGFPCSSVFSVNGQKVKADIYAFKMKEDSNGKRSNAKDNYSKKEGVVFSVNGQAHGYLDKSFFTRKKVGLGYLKDSVLVHVDCSGLSNESLEKVFMNSRDRLRDGPIRDKIKSEIEQVLGMHIGLKDLSLERREKAIHDKLSDEKPMADILSKVIQLSPALSSILQKGVRLSAPFKTKRTKKKALFEGKNFPTFFAPVKTFVEEKPRGCELGRKANIKFSTDVENQYLSRSTSPGSIRFDSELYGELETSVELWNGAVSVVLELPAEAAIGDVTRVIYEVMDDSRAVPISDSFWMKVVEKTEKPVSPKKPRKKRTSGDEDGDDDSGKSQLALPEVVPVLEKDWDEYGIGKEDALFIRHNGESYDFFYNKDNVYLLHEQKAAKIGETDIIEMQFKAALVLIGLSIINATESDSESEGIEDIVQTTSKQIAPVILPMIRGLGGLTDLG